MGSDTQQFCLRWNSHRNNLLDVFNHLLQSESFTDVTFVCDGGAQIKCHKVVLAACSPYFQELFSSLSCKHPVVVLKDVKYAEIKAILEYMYRGEVMVLQEEISGLVKVAQALKVKGLSEDQRINERSLDIAARENQPMQDSPPTITTSSSNLNSSVHSSSNSSPPHSTNGLNFSKNPYSMYGKASGMSHRMWAMPGLPIPPHTSTAASTPSHPAVTAAAAIFSQYEAAHDMSPLKRKKLSSLLMNRDTPILRTVLGQGQADSSQPVSLVCHPDSFGGGHSNGSETERPENKMMKTEPSEDAQSPYTDLSIMEDDEKSKMAVPSTSPQSFIGVSPGIATYVPSQKPEWKRYKQYTRNDIMSAIEAVRNGMSALQAARKYGVPSRTLYDKVKKLGITTSRPFKRGSNGSSACFPYGLSGTNSPYGHLSESEEHGMNNNSSLLEAMQHVLESRTGDEREALAAMAAAAAAHAGMSGHSTSPPDHRAPSPSPSPNLIKYMHQNSMTPSPAAGSDNNHSETNGSSEREHDDEEDQVEDLSVHRKQESRVIMPPMNQVSTIIKKDEIPDVLREEIRREEARREEMRQEEIRREEIRREEIRREEMRRDEIRREEMRRDEMRREIKVEQGE